MDIKIEVKACEHGLCRCMARKIEEDIMPEAHAIGFREGCEAMLENLEMITDAVAKLSKAGKDHRPMVVTLMRRLTSFVEAGSDVKTKVEKEDFRLVN